MSTRRKCHCHNDKIAVFTATNPGTGVTGATAPTCPGVLPSVPSDNEILMFRSSESGKLTEIDREKTGGLGTGPGLTFCEDPLGSQGSITISSNGKFLFVVNAGTGVGTVSSMRIYQDKIKHIDTVSSGGVFPVSCASYKNLLYVLNGGADTNVTAFSISEDGKLQEIGVKANFGPITMTNGQPDFLFEFVKNPAQVGFSPDGRKLVVSVKDYAGPVNPGSLYVFDVLANGDLVNMVKNNSAGRLPWGFSFYKKYLIVAEIFGQNTPDLDPTGKGCASSYLLNNDNTLTPISISVPNSQTASCWLVVANNFAYVSNSRLVPGTISKYRIQENGQIVLVNGVEFSANTHILDTVAVNGKYLYVICPGALAVEANSPVNGSIKVLKISKHGGNLKLVQTLDLVDPLSGAMGIAAINFD